MTLYRATSIVEGFCDDTPTAMDELKAWAYLIKTGKCWRLQGFYGRGATDLIETGYITSRGQITKQGKEIYNAN